MVIRRLLQLIFSKLLKVWCEKNRTVKMKILKHDFSKEKQFKEMQFEVFCLFLTFQIKET